MPPIQQAILIYFAIVILVWAVRHIGLFVMFHKFHVLSNRSPLFQGGDAPLVTAIIPAKDEEAALAACLESVRAQNYPNLEILVVDDRSVDNTYAIAYEQAKQDPRVRVIRIEELPPGWTGKTHALHVASQHATGEWLWYLDADTRHQPNCLSIVLQYGASHRADLVSLIPNMRCETFWEHVVQPLAGIVLLRSFPLISVNRDSSRKAFANGQFILIKRTAYDEAGGHAAVRDRFVEDIGLAKNVKKLGKPIRVAMAREISSTRMYTSLPQLVRGWSRILFDALDRKAHKLVYKIVEPLIHSQTTYLAFPAAIIMVCLGVPEGPFAFWLLALTSLHLLMSLSVLYRMYNFSASTTKYVWWHPLAGLIMDWIFIKSIMMCFTGKVVWRDTQYGSSPTETPQPLIKPAYRLSPNLIVHPASSIPAPNTSYTDFREMESPVGQVPSVAV